MNLRTDNMEINLVPETGVADFASQNPTAGRRLVKESALSFDSDSYGIRPCTHKCSPHVKLFRKIKL